MWTNGAPISEIFALTPASFVDDGYDLVVILKTLKQHPRLRSKATPQRSFELYVPNPGYPLRDRVQCFLYAEQYRKSHRIFPIPRQTVNRHIKRLVERVGGTVLDQRSYLSA